MYSVQLRLSGVGRGLAAWSPYMEGVAAVKVSMCLIGPDSYKP